MKVRNSPFSDALFFSLSSNFRNSSGSLKTFFSISAPNTERKWHSFLAEMFIVQKGLFSCHQAWAGTSLPKLNFQASHSSWWKGRDRIKSSGHSWDLQIKNFKVIHLVRQAVENMKRISNLLLWYLLLSRNVCLCHMYFSKVFFTHPLGEFQYFNLKAVCLALAYY